MSGAFVEHTSRHLPGVTKLVAVDDLPSHRVISLSIGELRRIVQQATTFDGKVTDRVLAAAVLAGNWEVLYTDEELAQLESNRYAERMESIDRGL